MPVEIVNSRPLAPDGTSDWEAVFEDADTGLIPLIGQAQSTESLRACTIVALGKLLIRKNDEAAMERLTHELDRIIADGGEGAEGLDASKDAITTLLRRIKENRKQKAAAHVANKRADKGGDRRAADEGADTIGGTPARVAAVAGFGAGAGDTLAQRRRQRFLNIASAALVVGLTTLVMVLVHEPDTKTDGVKEAAWVRHYVSTHLPDETWELASVRPTEESKIDLEVLITEPRHVKMIKGVKRMTRVKLLNNVCPPVDSGVMFVLENGWNLWVTLKAGDELLTGGTCRY